MEEVRVSELVCLGGRESLPHEKDQMGMRLHDGERSHAKGACAC